MERTDQDLVTRRLPNGAEMLELNGRYQHAQVVSLQAGKPSLVCADRATAVDHILSHAETSKAP